MQFQVPQFIDTEDKIVGPLTLKQFLYICAGGGLTFFFYFTTTTIVFLTLSVLSMGIALALAFVKVNGKGLPQILVAAVEFYWRPQVYVWQPEQPAVVKSKENTLVTKEGFSLEKVVAGMALNNAWRYLQTGSKAPEEPKPKEEQITKPKEIYQAYHEITGERKVARRIDYR